MQYYCHLHLKNFLIIIIYVIGLFGNRFSDLFKNPFSLYRNIFLDIFRSILAYLRVEFLVYLKILLPNRHLNRLSSQVKHLKKLLNFIYKKIKILKINTNYK